MTPPRRFAPDPATDDDDLLTEIRDRYTYATNEWGDIRADAKDDMRYVGGDPWDPKDRKQREDAGRPCLALDELHQYFNQCINDVRANPRSPKFEPTGNGANDQTAQFYSDKQREIEYRSQAQVAYTTAFQNAIHQSYGWMRYTTKYAPKSFDLDLWIEDVPNPDLIVGDPDALRPTSSDMKYLFDLTTMSVKEFRRTFPDAQVTDFTPQIISQAPTWIQPERIQVAKYWTVEPQARQLFLLQLPTGQVGAYYDTELAQMPPGAQVIQSRVEEVPTVGMYLTNGVEILMRPGQASKRVPWAGKYIPYISCFGMVIYVDEGSGPKRKILSMTRLARDPYMLYCYYRTSQAELVGMTPKVPYFVRRGSLKPDQLLALQKSLHEPIAVIQVENFVDGLPAGAPPEFPQRNPFEPAIQSLEIGAESARQAIQAAMGVSPLPTPAQQSSPKSGLALRQIESSQQKGSFHFVDHYEAMLQHSGVVAEDLMDKVYDTARTVPLRDAQGNTRSMRINDPTQQPGPTALPSIAGDHAVTITTGPAYESQRQEATDFVDTMVQNIGMIAQVAGPKAASAIIAMGIKLKNIGPVGDEMYEIIMPPELMPNAQGQPGLPPQVQAMIQQLQQQNQQLQQALQSKQAEAQAKGQIDLQKTQLQEQADTQRTQMDNQTALEKANIAANATMAASQVKVDAENFRSYVDAMQAHLEKQLDIKLAPMVTAVQHLHEARTQTADQLHEIGMARLEHAHALQQAQQAAALQPPPQPAQPAQPDSGTNGSGV
jgi:hypothetical protein